MDPDETPQRPHKRTSRLRSAIDALRGAPTTPEAMRAEWVAWQFEFDSVLDKLSAAAARMYTRDKVELKRALKRIDELEADVEQEQAAAPLAGWNPDKIALNRRALALRGIRVPDFPTNGEQSNVDVPSG